MMKVEVVYEIQSYQQCYTSVLEMQQPVKMVHMLVDQPSLQIRIYLMFDWLHRDGWRMQNHND